MLRTSRPRPRGDTAIAAPVVVDGDHSHRSRDAKGFRHHPVAPFVLLGSLFVVAATLVVTGLVPWNHDESHQPSVAASLASPQRSPSPTLLSCADCWTVVWLIAMEWEVYYVPDILQHLPLCQPTLRYNHQTYRTHGQSLELPNHAILITNYKPNALLRPAIHQLKQSNFTFVTFLLSDEIKPHTNGCSSDRPQHGERIQLLLDESALVLRNYWSPDCAGHAKVQVVPLHVTAQDHAGFVEHCGQNFGTPPLDRPHFLYFASSHVLKVRNELVRAIRESVELTESIDHRNKKASVEVHYPVIPPMAQYSRSLSSTRFGVVLSGSNPDTWRFTETLFCGAIPLVDRAVHDYYRHWLPPELMRLVPHFDANATSIQEKLRELLALSDEAYLEWRTQLVDQAARWYRATRLQVAQRVREAACGDR